MKGKNKPIKYKDKDFNNEDFPGKTINSNISRLYIKKYFNQTLKKVNTHKHWYNKSLDLEHNKVVSLICSIVLYLNSRRVIQDAKRRTCRWIWIINCMFYCHPNCFPVDNNRLQDSTQWWHSEKSKRLIYGNYFFVILFLFCCCCFEQFCLIELYFGCRW